VTPILNKQKKNRKTIFGMNMDGFWKRESRRFNNTIHEL